MKSLEAFHRQITRRIMVKMDWRIGEESLEWPPVEEAIEAAGLCKMKLCVRRQQATIVEYIVTCPIFEFCNGVEWIPGSNSILM